MATVNFDNGVVATVEDVVIRKISNEDFLVEVSSSGWMIIRDRKNDSSVYIPYSDAGLLEEGVKFLNASLN